MNLLRTRATVAVITFQYSSNCLLFWWDGSWINCPGALEIQILFPTLKTSSDNSDVARPSHTELINPAGLCNYLSHADTRQSGHWPICAKSTFWLPWRRASKADCKLGRLLHFSSAIWNFFLKKNTIFIWLLRCALRIQDSFFLQYFSASSHRIPPINVLIFHCYLCDSKSALYIYYTYKWCRTYI